MKQYLLFWMAMAMSLLLKAQTEPLVTYSDCLDKSLYDTVYYQRLSQDKITIEGYLYSCVGGTPEVTITQQGNDIYIAPRMPKCSGSDYFCYNRFKAIVYGCTGNEYRLHYKDQKDQDSLVKLTRYIPTPSVKNWCDTSTHDFKFRGSVTDVALRFYRTQNATEEITSSVKITSSSKLTGMLFDGNDFLSQIYTVPSKLISLANDTATVWAQEYKRKYYVGNYFDSSPDFDASKPIKYIKIVVYDTVKLEGIRSINVESIYADSLTLEGTHVPNSNKKIASVSGPSSIYIGGSPILIQKIGVKYDVELAGSQTGVVYWIASNDYDYSTSSASVPNKSFSMDLFPNNAPQIEYSVAEIGDRYSMLSVKNCACKMPKDLTVTSERFNNQACKGMKLLLKANKQDSAMFDFSWENNIYISTACVGCPQVISREIVSFAENKDQDTITMPWKGENSGSQFSPAYLTVKPHNCPDREFEKSIPFQFSTSSDTLPSPPKVKDTSINRNTAAKITALGKSLKWYNDLKSTSPTAKDTLSVSTATPGTQTLYVTQTNGTCESEPAKMSVTVVEKNDTVIKTKGKDYELEYGKKAGTCGVVNEKLSYIYGDNSLTIQGYVLTNSCAIPQTDITVTKSGNLSTVHITQKDTAKNQCNCFGPRWFKLTLNGSFDTTRIIKDQFYGSAIDTTITRSGTCNLAIPNTQAFIEAYENELVILSATATTNAIVQWMPHNQSTVAFTGTSYTIPGNAIGVYHYTATAYDTVSGCKSLPLAITVTVVAKNDTVIKTKGKDYELEYGKKGGSCGAVNEKLSYIYGDNSLTIQGYVLTNTCAIPQTDITVSKSDNLSTVHITQKDTAKNLCKCFGPRWFKLTLNGSFDTTRIIKDQFYGAAIDTTITRSGTCNLAIPNTQALVEADEAAVPALTASLTNSKHAVICWQSAVKSSLTPDFIGASYQTGIKSAGEYLFRVYAHDTLNACYSQGTLVTLKVYAANTPYIKGTVLANNVGFAAASVVAYKKTGNEYTVIANAHCNTNGAFTIKWLDKGTYLLQAIPENKAYLPSYYINNTSWIEAYAINLIGRLETLNFPLLTIEWPVNGAGVISGTLSRVNSKSSESVLKTAITPQYPVFATQNGVIVAYALTDENGNYQINNLPDGAYDVYVEIPGYQHTAQTITIANGTSVTANFNAKDGVITDETIKKDITLLTISPNPAANSLNIQSASAIHLVEVCSVTGQTLLRVHGNSSNIDLSSLSSGMYLVRVQTESETSTHTIVKQ